MLHPMNSPEQDPAPTDGFDRLEEIHQRMKREQEAWRKLLESLDKAKQKRTEDQKTEKPDQ
jgi:hypothetical protein